MDLSDILALPLTAVLPVHLGDGSDLGIITEHFCRSAFRGLILRSAYGIELHCASGVRRGFVDLAICRSSPGILCLDEGLAVKDLERDAQANWLIKTCLPRDTCPQTAGLHSDVLDGIRGDHALQISLRFLSGCSCWVPFPVPYRLHRSAVVRRRRPKKGSARNLQWELPLHSEEIPLLIVGAGVRFSGAVR